MTDQELECRLARAVEHAAPDDLEEILSRCQEQKGTVIAMTNKKNLFARRWAALAACLALLLVGGGGGYLYQQAHAVASVVSLDVNPSVELKVNRSRKVLSCVGLNDDADEVLKDMGGGADLKGTKLDVAVNALIGAMVRTGYLDDISSAILISVEDENAERAVQLRQDLTVTVGEALGEQSAAASILTQTVETDDKLEKLAEQNNISTGKAVLIGHLMDMNGDLTFESLAGLSVEELHDLEEIGAPAMPIGKDKALEYAMGYAGVTDLTGLKVDVDAELDDDIPCYEVEIGTDEYQIGAWDGKLLSVEREEPDDDRDDIDDDDDRDDIDDDDDRDDIDDDDDRDDIDDDDDDRDDIDDDDDDRDDDDDDDDDDRDDDDDDDDDREVSVPAKVTREQAVSAALTHAGLHHNQVTDLETERDHGCWEVEFEHGGCEYEYKISAENGKVLHCEREACDNGGHHGGHHGGGCRK